MFYRFQKPARPVTRIFLHCSASDRPEHDSAAVIDAWHKANGWAGIGYHYFIRKDGTLELGRDIEKVPAAQGGHNTGTIAICLHGLAIDKFTSAQFSTLRGLCGQIDRAYSGGVTFHGHCEVSAKSCPVFVYEDILGIDHHGRLPHGQTVSIPKVPMPDVKPDALEVLLSPVAVLRLGSKGDDVRALQTLLTKIGYHTGAIDGDFGPRTRASVVAFQIDNHLEADGMVGALTREALALPGAREIAPARAFASLPELAKSGSRIAQASIANGIVGAILGGGGLVTVIEQLPAAIAVANGQAGPIEKLFSDYGLIGGGAVLAAGVFIAVQSWRAGQARLQDHRTGKTS